MTDDTYDIQEDFDEAQADPVRSARIERFYRENDHPYHEACPKCWARFQAMRRRAERAERRAFVLEGALDLLIDFARDYDPDGSATGPALDVLGGRVK